MRLSIVISIFSFLSLQAGACEMPGLWCGIGDTCCMTGTITCEVPQVCGDATEEFTRLLNTARANDCVTGTDMFSGNFAEICDGTSVGASCVEGVNVLDPNGAIAEICQ